MGRNSKIDLLKAVAIVSVIILHSITDNTMRNQLGIPFLVLQAVPIFMILMGLNNSRSFIKINPHTFREAFSWDFFEHRFDRIIFVYFFAVSLEVLVTIVIRKVSFTDIILLYLTGGIGPGSYFVPIMIQTLFILPILYVAANKNANYMLLGSFVVNMIFEIWAYHIGMHNGYYRLLFPRYLFAAALGVWIVKKDSIKWSVISIGAIFSLTYITSIHYWGFTPPVQPDWLSQNAPSYLWPFAIVLFGLRKFPARAKGIWEYCTELGKASYHIFLVQMVYFWTIGNLLRVPVRKA